MGNVWIFEAKFEQHSLFLAAHGIWFYSNEDFGDSKVELSRKKDAELITKILTNVFLRGYNEQHTQPQEQGKSEAHTQGRRALRHPQGTGRSLPADAPDER